MRFCNVKIWSTMEKHGGKEMEVAFLQCENMVGGKRDGKEMEVAFLQCENMIGEKEVVRRWRWEETGTGCGH